MSSRPARTRYGPHRSQAGELWLPDVGSRPAPLVVLIHGGFWRGTYTKRLMHGLARAIRGRGLAAWNIEYRRVGRGGGGGGWPATFADVAAAIDHIAALEGIDGTRVVTCGHSAGGQLALWAAGRARLPAGSPGAGPLQPIRGAISLAGVVDLRRAADQGLGHGATTALLGGGPREVPERYDTCSPAALLPLGVPQVLVHGDQDTAVPPAMSELYRSEASAAGDDVRLVTLPGVGHRELISPRGRPWAALVAAVDQLTA